MIPSSEKTNGQVVMEALRPVFPNVKVKKVEDYCGFGGFSRHIELIIDNWVAGFPIEWWEEPYEGEIKAESVETIDKQTLWNKAGTSNHITRADVNVRPPKDNSGTQALNEGYAPIIIEADKERRE